MGSGASAGGTPTVYRMTDQSSDLRENTAAKKRSTKPAES